jgi:hypothetical protein
MSRDRSVGLATCYELDGPGIESQVIPVAERSNSKNTHTAARGGRQLVCFYPKAWVCGRSLAGFAVSNPAGGMDICVVCVVSKDKRQNAR